MTDSARPHLEPGPDHPITVESYNGRVVVKVGGNQVAESDRALQLKEASYPAVFYIPVADVTDGSLQSNDQHTYCPYKGEASYYDLLPQGGEPLTGAVWYYPDPYPAVDTIRDHVAFYPDRVEITTGS